MVVTGGASGIGRALCMRFAAEGAAAVVVADRDGPGAEAVAAQAERAGRAGILTRAVMTDVTVEADVVALIETTESELGPIDLFCSNAGIALPGGVDATDEAWALIWAVNVMSHVYAARALIPRMTERGSGYLLNTASAAGLLTQLGSAPYSVTKHAAEALAEWMAITYGGDTGIRFSCLCPQGVRTPMLVGNEEPNSASSPVLAAGGMLEPEDVAEAVVAGLADERFLILPHPEVHEYLRRRVDDPDRWLRGMRRQWQRILDFRSGGGGGSGSGGGDGG